MVVIKGSKIDLIWAKESSNGGIKNLAKTSRWTSALTAESLDDAIDKIKARHGEDFKSYVMPQGGLIYPCLRKCN